MRAHEYNSVQYRCRRVTITKPPFCNWTLLDFSCPFLILPSLRNYRDMGEMSLWLCLKFYLKTFCPLFVVIACRRFWTDLFAILWQRAEPPNSKSDGAIPKQVASRRVKPKQGRVLRAYGAENENSCGGNEFYSSAVEDHRALATSLWSLSELIYGI